MHQYRCTLCHCVAAVHSLWQQRSRTRTSTITVHQLQVSVFGRPRLRETQLCRKSAAADCARAFRRTPTGRASAERRAQRRRRHGGTCVSGLASVPTARNGQAPLTASQAVALPCGLLHCDVGAKLVLRLCCHFVAELFFLCLVLLLLLTLLTCLIPSP